MKVTKTLESGGKIVDDGKATSERIEQANESNSATLVAGEDTPEIESKPHEIVDGTSESDDKTFEDVETTPEGVNETLECVDGTSDGARSNSRQGRSLS